MAVDQTVYEGGEGFTENLKTDDNLLRERVMADSVRVYDKV